MGLPLWASSWLLDRLTRIQGVFVSATAGWRTNEMRSPCKFRPCESGSVFIGEEILQSVAQMPFRFLRSLAKEKKTQNIQPSLLLDPFMHRTNTLLRCRLPGRAAVCSSSAARTRIRRGDQKRHRLRRATRDAVVRCQQPRQLQGEFEKNQKFYIMLSTN